MRIHEVEQLSPEWFELRRGIPTASEFNRIITAVKGDLSESCEGYIYELLAERAELRVPQRGPWMPTADMIRGRELEPEARDWFAFEHDIPVRQVGLITSDCGRFGCSPDGLILNDTEGLEIKSPKLAIQAKRLADSGLPKEVKPQVHGGMAVTGLDRWRFISYSPGLPALVVQVERDEYTDRVQRALEIFWSRMEEVAKRLGVSLTPAEATV